MKKIIFFLVLAISSWGFYKNNTTTSDQKDVSETQYSTTYECDGREYCSQMTSYEEAKFFIQNCPNTKMDGDRDGEPCESQFSRW